MRASLLVAAVAAASVFLSTVPRVLASVGALPPPWLLFGWSDVLQTWKDSGLAGHHLPFRDVAFEYPPVVGYVAGALSLASDGYVTYLIGWSCVVALSAAVAAAALTRHAGWRRGLIYWALTPQLLLFSAINFDVLAATAVTLAAIAARRGREGASLVALAFGTATKLFPVVSAPLLPLRLAMRGQSRRSLAALAAFGVALVGLYLPATLAPSSILPFTSAYAYGAVTNVDSIWGIIRELALATGHDLTGWIVPISLLGAGVTYLILVVPRAIRAADPVVGFALATVTLLFWSRLYSPQYSLWLLPFFVLLPFRRDSFVALTVADVVVFFTTYPLTLLVVAYDVAVVLRAFLIGAVLLRHGALLLMARDCLALARPGVGARP